MLIAAALFAIQGGEYSTTDLLRQRAQGKRLTAEIDSLEHIVDSLQRYAHAVETDPAVQERIAREEFGMVKDHEILYRFAEPADSSPGGGTSHRAP